MADDTLPRAGLTAPPSIAGLSTLAADYDVILCDIWGVLHNGIISFAQASDALIRARAGGACVVLITNAPRPRAEIIAMLDRLGVPRDAYDGIVTSGDVTRALLEAKPGARVFHLGPPRDRPTFEGIDVTLTPLADCDLVACTGLFDDETETPDTYLDMLTAMKARDLPILCANPDIVVERGDKLIYCAGAIARLYEELGGAAVYCGKPYGPIYDTALALAAAARGEPAARERILAIGDGLHTDIVGANGMGFDCIFIAGGIHAIELKILEGNDPEPEALAGLFHGHTHPKGVMPRLFW